MLIVLQVYHLEPATVLRHEGGLVAARVLDRHHAKEEHRLVEHAQVVGKRAVGRLDEVRRPEGLIGTGAHRLALGVVGFIAFPRQIRQRQRHPLVLGGKPFHHVLAGQVVEGHPGVGDGPRCHVLGHLQRAFVVGQWPPAFGVAVLIVFVHVEQMIFEVTIARCRVTIITLSAGLRIVKDATQQSHATIGEVGDVVEPVFRMAVEVVSCLVVLKPPDAVAHGDEVGNVHLAVLEYVLSHVTQLVPALIPQFGSFILDG